MTTRTIVGAVVGCTFLLLLLGATATSAHKEHATQAARAADAAPHPADLPPASSQIAESEPRDRAEPIPPRAVRDEPKPHVPESNVPRPLAWLGKFHPPLTHFPIALLIAAAGSELLFIRSGKVLFEHSVRCSVWFGATGALAAAVLGWLLAGFQLTDDEWAMTAHRWTGSATALWAVGLLHLSERASAGAISRASLRAALFSGAALVGATGFFGGALIYGLDHYRW